MSEDISPAKMKCGKCEYTTETEIPEDSSVAEKQQQLKFHLERHSLRIIVGKLSFLNQGLTRVNLWRYGRNRCSSSLTMWQAS